MFKFFFVYEAVVCYLVEYHICQMASWGQPPHRRGEYRNQLVRSTHSLQYDQQHDRGTTRCVHSVHWGSSSPCIDLAW